VRSALHSGVTEGGGPAWGLKFAGNSMALQVVKDASSFVGKAMNILREVVGGPETAYRVVPAMSPKKSSGAKDMLT
jgi:hypothetical protein